MAITITLALQLRRQYGGHELECQYWRFYFRASFYHYLNGEIGDQVEAPNQFLPITSGVFSVT